MELVKSCINYTGGKYRLLKQILPLFPEKINCFVDLFCGAANVSLNIAANKIYCYDNNQQLIDLMNFIKSNDVDKIVDSVLDLIIKYDLSQTDKFGYDFYKCNSKDGLSKFNKDKYLKLRDDFNSNNFSIYDKSLYFYVLVIYAFNNQIRFNKKNYFNVPVGKRDFNKNTRKNLKNFHDRSLSNDLIFKCNDFRLVDLGFLSDKDFVYADPPYLITTASYNEQNNWTEKEEKNLLNILDKLNKNDIKFALSNVIESRGKENIILKNWANDYEIHYLNYNYNNSNYQIKNKSRAVEVLVCNY